MAAPIDDVSKLPGRKVSDQAQTELGQITDVYAMESGFPMWVAVQTKAGIGRGPRVFVPLARLKEENGELRVPYSKSHILESPEVDAEDSISEECDHALRTYYGIGAADQELWSDNKGYATLVPDEAGPASRAEDVDQLETPNADKRTDETISRMNDPGPAQTRQISANDVAAESADDDTSAGEDEPA
jgi:hypothetical protein